jgi:LysM repeat protein
MLKVDRKLYERAVLQILEAQKTEQLLTAFSLNRVLLYSLLNDVSMGKGSPNYHVLKHIAHDRNIDEHVIFERADSIISDLTEDNEEEDYTKRFPVLPFLVTGRFTDIVSVNFVYLSLLILAVLILTFYLAKSGPVFFPREKGELSQKYVETKTSPKSPIVLDSPQGHDLSMDKEPNSKHESRKGHQFRSKKEPSTNEVIREESKKSKLLKEQAKLSGRQSLNVELTGTSNMTVQSSAREFIDAAELNAGDAEISNNTGIEYVVKEGDTLWSVASMYKISVQDLKALNSLHNNNLTTGQVLIAPRGLSLDAQQTLQTKTEQGTKTEKTVKEAHTFKEPERNLSQQQQIKPEDRKRAEVIAGIREEVSLSDGKGALKRGPIETKNPETISRDGAGKAPISNLQVDDQRAVQKEGGLSVLKDEDVQKEPNIPKTTTSFEPDSIKEIKSRLWNSDRNILGPE